MIACRGRKRLDDDDDDNDDEDDDVDDDDNDDANEEEEEEEQSVLLLSNRWDMLQPFVLRSLGILAHGGVITPPAGERCRFWQTAGVLQSTLPGLTADSLLLPHSAASAMPNI